MEYSGKLDAIKSLDIITKAIEQTRDNIKEESFYYILWGWLMSVAALGNYVLFTFTDFKYAYLPWLILVPVGWIASFIYARKKERIKTYETYIQVFLKYLWIVLGVSFLVSVNMSVWLNINPSTFVLLLAGIGTLVSGLTMKFKPLSVGGIILFGFAISTLLLEPSYSLLITGIAIVTGYLIPAYLLKNSN